MKGDIVIWMSGREKITDEKWERIFGKKEIKHGTKTEDRKDSEKDESRDIQQGTEP